MSGHKVVELNEYRADGTVAASDATMRTPSRTTKELAAGTKLLHGQYTLTGYLNSGGFGITYRALDSLSRNVVIKECYPSALCLRSDTEVVVRKPEYNKDLAAIVGQFVAEARALARLKHKNIVHVHQVFMENETAYMAMDFVDGLDLLTIVEEHPSLMTPRDIERVARKLLRAIAYTHERGLLHRDISPDNILIDKNGEPVLIDFGAARNHDLSVEETPYQLKFVKDGYSPEEFYDPDRGHGEWSDLYSFGASLYHLITSRPPVDADARGEALAKGEDDPYRPLAGRYGGFSPNFLTALDKALGFAPEDRHQSAKEWLDALNHKVVSETNKSLDGPYTALDGPVSRAEGGDGKGRIAMIVVAAALVLAGVAWFSLNDRPEAEIAATVPVVETAPPAVGADASVVGPETDIAGLPPATPMTELAPAAAAPLAGVDYNPASLPPQTEATPASAPSGIAAVAPVPTTPTAPADAEAEAAPRMTPIAPPRPTVRVVSPQVTSTPASDTAATLAAIAPAPTPRTAERLVPVPTIDPVALAEPAPRFALASVPPPAPRPEAPASGPARISAHWDVAMPFEATIGRLRNSNTAMITKVMPGADLAISGNWIAAGTVIYGFNGAPLRPESSVAQHVLDAISVDPDGFSRATVLFREVESGRIERGLLAVPAVRRIAAPDGTVFEGRRAPEGWSVTVIETGGATDLRAGDRLLRENVTETEISDHGHLTDALNLLLSQRQDAAFVVERAGAEVTAQMPLRR